MSGQLYIILAVAWSLLAATLPEAAAREAALAPTPAESAVAARARGLDAVRAGRWHEARAALQVALCSDPQQPELLYAIAVCCVQLGEGAAALEHLNAAAEAGFQDYHLLKSDSRLAALRVLPGFTALVKSSEKRHEAFAADLEAGVRESYRETPFRVRRVAAPRVVLVSDLDDRMAGNLVSVLAGQEAGHRLVLFPNGLRHAIVVHEPRPQANGGNPLPGLFSPAARTLQVSVSAPTGGLLREFARALHFDDQAARGQVHAAWLRAGIATLYENSTIAATGIRGLKDWRLGSLKSAAARAGGLPLLSLLTVKAAAAGPDTAAEARYLLYWLQETRRLRSFYSSYVERFDEDPTGRLALESVTGKPLAAVEKEWLSYLRTTSLTE